MIICPKCNMQNMDDSMFCKACGNRLYPPQAPAQLAPQPHYAPYPPYRPKPRLAIIATVVVVAVVIIACICIFAVKWGEEKKASTITNLELCNDYDINTTSYKTYNVGDTVNIHDTIVRVEYSSMGVDITGIFFASSNGTYYDFPLIVKGDKRSDYHVGDTVTIPVVIREFTVDGRKIESAEMTMLGWALGYGSGSTGIECTDSDLSSGNLKITISSSPALPISNFSATLKDHDGVIIDSMGTLTVGTSSGGQITFNDANYNGILDYGDYFIVSGISTGSEYIYHSYTFKIESKELYPVSYWTTFNNIN